MKAKKAAPHFVDGVAILSGSGDLSLGGGAPRAQTFRTMPFRAAANDRSSASAGKIMESSTRSSISSAQSSAQSEERGPIPPQFATVATDGNRISLAQYRGRVVLLDFWATWCPPSREEAPQIVQMYQQYHSSGLEIIGASFDHNYEAMKRFTSANGMTWRQIYGGHDWDSELAQLYGVDSIPSNVLIGRDGTALAVGLHGPFLQAAIEYALAEK